MATHDQYRDEEKWERFECRREGSDHHEEVDEEEALSLCDLPLNLVKQDNQTSKQRDDDQAQQEDFEFRSWRSNSEMCIADDVFFQGQLLPFRFSVSSDQSNNQKSKLSRTWSTGHNSKLSIGSTSFSSRSSSSNSSSQYSTSSGSRSPVSTPAITRKVKPRIQNHYYFHTYPSPKPQIRLSSSRSTGSMKSRRSSVWDVLRLGLVPTPEIQLQDLKARTSVSRNSSSSSSNSNSNMKKGNSSRQRKQKQRKQRTGGGLMLSGCSCTVNSVIPSVPVPVKIGIVKSRNDEDGGRERSSSISIEEKLQELKIKKRKKATQKQKIMSRSNRTFEWIKELSHSHAKYVGGAEEEEEDHGDTARLLGS